MKIKSYKKKDGKTYYMFNAYIGKQDSGKKIFITRRGFKTKKEAQIEYVKLLDENKRVFACKFTFKEVYDMWIPNYKKTVRESTFYKNVKIFEHHILPALGHYRMDKIKVHMLQEIINEWHEKLVQYKRIKNLVSNIFKHAIRNGYIKENPCDLLLLPKERTTQKKKNYLEKEELELFLSTMRETQDKKWYVFFRLLAFSGMRRGEAMALTWSDIDFKKNTISINKTLAAGINHKALVQPPKTRSSKRIIDMDTNTMHVLKDFKRSKKTIDFNGIVFSNESGGHLCLSYPGKIADQVCKETNLYVTPHGLRHTHCSILFEAGATLAEVKERLGHSSIKTTMDIYNHVSKKKKEEVAEKLSEYLAF